MTYWSQNAFILAWQPNLVQKVVDSQPWSPNTPLKHLIVNSNATIPPKCTLFYEPPVTHPPLSINYPFHTLSPQTPLLHWSAWGLKTPIKVSEGKNLCAFVFEAKSMVWKKIISKELDIDWIAVSYHNFELIFLMKRSGKIWVNRDTRSLSIPKCLKIETFTHDEFLLSIFCHRIRLKL